MRPRILLIGGTYRALCVLERLIERGERVVAFLGQEGDGERDFCAEILELCDRASIPARSGRKLGEEMVRWLEDRIRPELAISVGLSTELPLAIGGNARLGLVEVVDLFQSESCPGVVLRQRGQDVITRPIRPPESAEEREDVFLQVVDEIVGSLDRFLEQLQASHRASDDAVRFSRASLASEHVERMASGSTGGRDADALEAAVAEWLGAESVVALRSPARAFGVLLDGLGIGSGDEVICPGLVSAYVPEVLRERGAVPVFADVDPDRLTLDPRQAVEAAGPRARAMVIAHALGQPAELDALYGIAEELSLEVIEDAGSAFGARFGEARIGRAPCTSLFRLPLDPECGEPTVALLSLPAKLYASLGGKLEPLRIGAEAALARRAFERWEDVLSARRENASALAAALSPYDAFLVPSTPDGALPVWPAFLLQVTRFARTSADDLRKLLWESGVEVRRLFSPATDRERSRLSVTEEACSRGLLLPTRPGLETGDRNRLLDAIFDFAIG